MIFYPARCNGKNNFWDYTKALDYISRKKKKKAFLKFLRSLGHKQTIIEDYVKHIAMTNRSGVKEKYSYTDFVWFIMTNYSCCKEEDVDETYKHEYFW